ncbi:MAG: FAD-binding oxidoreductase [Planctomyces sp.]|jgi:glycolate oxidase FAD binding subunit
MNTPAHTPANPSSHATDLVIDYPARDMTITVGAAMPCSQLLHILRQEGQTLPIDIASEFATVGEMVLQDHCGPRQFGYGTLRDYVIGIAAVDGHGRQFHAGGRVVKNVAGYDLCRLLTGSNGKLGQLLHVTFKVRPLPATQQLIIAGFRTLQYLEKALNTLNTTATTPVILDVAGRPALPEILNTHTLLPVRDSSHLDVAAVLLIGFDGPAEACQWQINTITDELGDLPAWIQTALPADAFQQWLHIARNYCCPADNPPWLASITTPPSQVCAVLDAMNRLHCCTCGRAGNGRLWCWPATADENQPAADELVGIAALQQLTSDGPGCVQVLHARSAASTPAHAAVRNYTARLQNALGTN